MPAFQYPASNQTSARTGKKIWLGVAIGAGIGLAASIAIGAAIFFMQPNESSVTQSDGLETSDGSRQVPQSDNHVTVAANDPNAVEPLQAERNDVPILPRTENFDPTVSGFNPSRLRELYLENRDNAPRALIGPLHKLARNVCEEEEVRIYNDAISHRHNHLRYYGALALVNWRLDVDKGVRILVETDKVSKRTILEAATRGRDRGRVRNVDPNLRRQQSAALVELQSKIVRDDGAMQLFATLGTELKPTWKSLVNENDPFTRVFAMQRLMDLGLKSVEDAIPLFAATLSDRRASGQRTHPSKEDRAVQEYALDHLLKFGATAESALPQLWQLAEDKSAPKLTQEYALKVALAIELEWGRLHPDKQSVAGVAEKIGLQYMPDYFRKLAYIRVADVVNFEPFQVGLKADPNRTLALEFTERIAGLAAREVEFVTIGYTQDEGNPTSLWQRRPYLIVARTLAAVDQTGIRSRIKSSGGEDLGVHFPDARTIVAGTKVEIERAINRSNEKRDFSKFDWLNYPEYGVVLMDRPYGEPATARASKFNSSTVVFEQKLKLPTRRLANRLYNANNEIKERIMAFDAWLERKKREIAAASDRRELPPDEREKVKKQSEEFLKDLKVSSGVNGTIIEMAVQMSVGGFSFGPRPPGSEFLVVNSDTQVDQFAKGMKIWRAERVDINNSDLLQVLRALRSHISDWRRDELATLIEELLLDCHRRLKTVDAGEPAHGFLSKVAIEAALTLGECGSGRHVNSLSIVGLETNLVDLQVAVGQALIRIPDSASVIALASHIERTPPEDRAKTATHRLRPLLLHYIENGESETAIAACQIVIKMPTWLEGSLPVLRVIANDRKQDADVHAALQRAIASFDRGNSKQVVVRAEKNRPANIAPNELMIAPAAFDDWGEYRAPDRSFTALLPRVVPGKIIWKSGGMSTNPVNGEYREIIWRANVVDGPTFEISAHNLERGRDYKVHWQSASKQLGDQLLVDQPVKSIAVFSQERFFYVAGVPKAQRIYLTSKRSYILTWTGVKGGTHTADIAKFFASLEWTK